MRFKRTMALLVGTTAPPTFQVFRAASGASRNWNKHPLKLKELEKFVWLDLVSDAGNWSLS